MYKTFQHLLVTISSVEIQTLSEWSFNMAHSGFDDLAVQSAWEKEHSYGLEIDSTRCQHHRKFAGLMEDLSGD
jgi:hypothetical protein